MDIKCEIIERPAQTALCLRTTISVGKLAEFLQKAYGDVMQYITQKKLQIAGSPYAAYFNTDMQNLEVEAGIPVHGVVLGNDFIKPAQLPAGNVATCLFVGPYAEFEDAYDALNEFIEEKGLEAVGTAYEFYLNDAKQTRPEDLKTQIVLPLK